MAKQFIGDMNGFTPLIDSMVEKYGITVAAVYGKVWRYCQMGNNVCTASQDRIAKELGLSDRTIRDHLNTLVDAGYLEKYSSSGEVNTYKDTGITVTEVSIRFTERGKKLPEGWENTSEGGGKKLPTKIQVNIEDNIPLNESTDNEVIGYPKPVSKKKANANLISSSPDAAEFDAYQKDKHKKSGAIRKEHLEYLTWFTELTKITYFQTQYLTWSGAFDQWMEMDVIKEDIEKAINKLKDVNYQVVSPKSLTNTLNGIVASRKTHVDKPWNPYQ